MTIKAIRKEELNRPSSYYESRAKYDTLKEPEWFLTKIKDIFGKVSLVSDLFDPLTDDFLVELPEGCVTSFCVPPFSQAAKYLEIASDEILRKPDHKIAFLISARTEAYSWHDHVFGKASVLFVRGPFRFVGLDRGMSAAFVIYGNLSDLEIARLCSLGSLVTPHGVAR